MVTKLLLPSNQSRKSRLINWEAGQLLQQLPTRRQTILNVCFQKIVHKVPGHPVVYIKELNTFCSSGALIGFLTWQVVVLAIVASSSLAAPRPEADPQITADFNLFSQPQVGCCNNQLQ